MNQETLSQAAYRRLREDIASQKIAPNSAFTEIELARALDISRTPLRAALSRLQREGVIERQAGATVLVRAITVDKLLEILLLRKVLERAAAERVAERRGLTPELEAVRRDTSRLLEGTPDFGEFWDKDEAFHLEVAKAAELTILPVILTEQRAIVRRCTIIRTHTRFDDQLREHLDVLDAIEARDPAAARAAMSLHFDNMRTRSLGTLPGP
ncbi:GntR family transcriptional regulator [Rhodobacteraceae bacterium F11138]|nr:GntR family transcriptional regulator [Rhodobacteraceae bacterium F11138]